MDTEHEDEHEDLARRAAVHHALSETSRLRIVDALRLDDRSPSDLRKLTGLSSNLMAFHLDVLERVGVIARRVSEGDARRRYVTLRWDALDGVLAPPGLRADRIVFVCTHNAARSQFAAAWWSLRTTLPAASAGTDPAEHVHPLAIVVARTHGVDLSAARPRGYDEVDVEPDLVVSVCDRANEAGLPWGAPHLHWSVPDPVGSGRPAFADAFTSIRRRVSRLADARSRAA